MFKYTFLIFILPCICINVAGQKKNQEEIYLLDANFKTPAHPDSAKFFTRVLKINDTCWQWDTYNIAGPMIASEQYKIKNGENLHGRCIKYQPNGFVDSIGKVIDGKSEGSWYYVNDTGRVIIEKNFSAGSIINTRDLVEEARHKKEKDSNEINKDEKESAFPGGMEKWKSYLIKKFRYPDRAMKLQKEGMVIVRFVVNTEGETEDVEIFRSIEFSVDQEAMRIIRESPKWIPAYREGKIVKSYKKQPIVFKFF